MANSIYIATTTKGFIGSTQLDKEKIGGEAICKIN